MQIRHLKRLGVALLLAWVFFMPTTHAHAQDATPAKLSEADRAAVGRIEEYLNSVSTLESRFLQASSNGSYAEGKMYLSRPGKMRLQYDPPVPILIIVAKGNLIYVDKELQQVSYVDANDTPAGFLVREEISLFGDDLIITGLMREAQTLRLSLVRAKDPLEGALTLVFSDRPMQLKKWVVTDAQGVTTTVSLMGARVGAKIDPELFVFRDPRTNNTWDQF
ncbi:MAG: outer membrane lipoprotein carrier protein LolA [Rhodospirillales bacterium]|nr:outer membrane lipoprotein carrier protein LolA [Rhodospirillales bacterium]